MGRLLLCLPMISLLLCGCGGGGGEQLALTIRGEYLAMEGCSAQVAVTADYGQRVYHYEMDAAAAGEEVVLTLTAPELVAGMTARLAGEGSFLEYEDLILDTGDLGQSGLSPVSAFPTLLRAAREGYITSCGMEQLGEVPALRVTCGQPEGTPGEEVTTTLWFHPETHALLGGQVGVDGRVVLTCTCENFQRT